MIDRERRFWRKGLEDFQLAQSIDADAIRQALALLTLTGGVERAEIDSLLQRAPLLVDVGINVRKRVGGLLHQLYPGQRYLEPLRPDIVGEHLVDQVLATDTQLLGAGLVAKPAQALTVLTRLAKRQPPARRWLTQAFADDLERLAESAIQVAIETGDPIGQLLADELERRTEMGNFMNYGGLRGLEGALPEQTTALREAGAAIMAQMRAVLKKIPQPWQEAVQSEAARVSNNLALMRGTLGQRDAALNAAEEAVTLRRNLARARPDRFMHDLAGSLNNLANMRSDLGQLEPALQAAEEATHFARTQRNFSMPGLAMCVSNLALMLNDLRRHEEALRAAGEATDLYRKLVKARPDAFMPYLAKSLSNLAHVLSDLGRHEEALQAAEEAANLCRELARLRPDAFTPDAAMLLGNLSNALSGLGRREEALAAAEEARDLYRALAEARPDAFNPDLARILANVSSMSLKGLSNILSGLRRREAALAAAEEARDRYRALAEARPDAFNINLARSLKDLALMLGALGRHEAALRAAKEAVALYRELARTGPELVHARAGRVAQQPGQQAGRSRAARGGAPGRRGGGCLTPRAGAGTARRLHTRSGGVARGAGERARSCRSRS